MNSKDLFFSLKDAKVRKRNKTFIGIFLFIAIITILLKVIDTILLDLGWNNGSIHLGFAQDTNFIHKAYVENNTSMQTQIERHPNIFWTFTQFTWITTFILTSLMIFRFFKYDQKTLPTWLRWIMTQNTISLLAMYDLIVGMVFWSSMFKGFAKAFNSDLWWLEFLTTILVHSVIPLMTITYSIIYLVKDRKASILKEKFVLKGMIYPMIYIAYYILVAVTWKDPYPITSLHKNFINEIWKLPFALIGIYALLGLMIFIHNWLLLKFNKQYDPKNDYEIIMHRNAKIDKIQRKIVRKYLHK